jgi:hypothetical protein
VTVLGPVADTVALLQRRMSGQYEIDEWGFDPDLIAFLDPLMRLRWRVEVDGAEHVPARGPAVLVGNRRFGIEEPIALARGVRRATGRPVRFLGIADIAAAGPALRRLGGALNQPDELASLLRGGQVAALPLSRVYRRRPRAGSLPPESLAPALALRVPVLPVATIGGEVTGRWRILVGEPLALPAGAGPLAVAELAESAREGVQALLDEAFPPRWLLG